MKNYSSICKQRNQWSNAVKTNTDRIYGYSWGDPDLARAVDSNGILLGNYKKIKDEYILKHLDGYTTIVDIGSLSGKWTQFFLEAGKIICSDINEEGFEVIKREFPQDNIEFYLSKGYELEGIEDKSVDIVFCIDTLVRSEIGIVDDYIGETSRILKEDGRACLHLPCSDQRNSVERGFTPITEHQIRNICKLHRIEDVIIDTETINHGVLLLIGYGDK